MNCQGLIFLGFYAFNVLLKIIPKLFKALIIKPKRNESLYIVINIIHLQGAHRGRFSVWLKFPHNIETDPCQPADLTNR